MLTSFSPTRPQPGSPVVDICQARDAKFVVDVLVSAFEHDEPVIEHYYPELQDRRGVMRVFYNNTVRSMVGSGTVFGAYKDGRMVGASIWQPPGFDYAPRDVRREAHMRRAISRINPETAELMREGDGNLAAGHPDETHWYLWYVAVRGDQRGLGIGGALLEPVLCRADKEGIPCFVETPSEVTLTFYYRLGFELVRKSHPFPTAPAIWAMRREPR